MWLLKSEPGFYEARFTFQKSAIAALLTKVRSINVLVTGTFPEGVCHHTLYRLNHRLSLMPCSCNINRTASGTSVVPLGELF